MSKTALIYGSDTGVTEEITSLIKALLEDQHIDVLNVFHAEEDLFKSYDRFILGLSTWYDGELQSDWDEFFEKFQKIDFSDKKVVLFGLGDQEAYAEYFVDGLGIIGQIVIQNGGQLFGKWPTEGYVFEKSKGLLDKDYFYGLALDEDNQPELTDERIEKWLLNIKEEGFWS